MGQGTARIFNFISIVFLILTAVVVVMGVSRLSSPPPVQRADTSIIPDLAVLPTFTPSNTPQPPTRTPIPTWTPSETPSETPTETVTLTITVLPSVTITDTPDATATLTITPSPPLTDTPSGPTAIPSDTPSPFPFALRDNQVILTANRNTEVGCAFQGIGGEVFDLNGLPLSGIRVHVFDGASFDQFSASGTNTLYGAAGWEVPVDTQINSQTYFVELQSEQGTIISPRVQVTFPQDCARNLAIVSFQQSRPF